MRTPGRSVVHAWRGLRGPAAPQRPVNLHQRRRRAGIALHQQVACAEHLAFGVQQRQLVDAAGGVAFAGDVGGFLSCLRSDQQLGCLLRVAREAAEGVLGLFKCRQHRLLVDQQAALRPGFGRLDTRLDPTEVEGGPAERSTQRVDPRAAAGQIAQAVAVQPEQATQAHAWKAIGNCHTDVGRAGGQLTFSDTDVGPAAQQLGRRAHRPTSQVGQRQARHGLWCAQNIVHRSAGLVGERGQTLNRACHLQLQRGNAGRRAGHKIARPRHVQLGAAAGGVPHLGQPQGLSLVGQ